MADEDSYLFRAMHPEHIPVSQELASDQLNASMYIAYVMASMWSSKKPGKFVPLRTYPGSPFDTAKKAQPLVDPSSLLGGYRSMTLDEAKAWAEARGLPI